MSDRDDIDVIDKAENTSANVDGKSNNAIRQNPPTESAKKPGFLERLKRVFTTDDEFIFDDESVTNREDDIGQHNDAHTSEKASARSVNKASEPSVQKNITAENNKPKMQSTATTGKKQDPQGYAAINQEKITGKGKKKDVAGVRSDDRYENTAAEDEKTKSESPEELAEEEEELLMINAFLDGEEYEPPENNKIDETSSEKSDPDKEPEQKDNETDTAGKEEASSEEYDSQDAFEDEDAVFAVDDEEEGIEAAEFVDDGAKVELTGSEDLNQPDKAEESADENTGENNSEPSSAADKNGEADTKNADDTAEKNVQDNLGEAADIEEKTDSDTGENSEAAGDPDSGIKDDNNSIDAEAAEVEDRSEKDEKSEKSEIRTEDSQDSENPADEPNSGSTDNKPEETEEKSEKNSIPTEELIEDEDDEEFIIDEDFLFDESEEDPIDDIKGSSDEFGAISEMLKSDEESSGEKTPDTKEYASKELRVEPLDLKTEHIDAKESEEISENAEESEEKPEEKSDTAEKSKEKPEENSDTAEKSEEKPEEKSDTAEKSEEKPEGNSDTAEKSEEKPEGNSDTAEKSEEKPEENSDTAEKSEEKPEENSDTAEESEEKTDEKPDGESGRIIDVTEITPVDEKSEQKKTGIGKIAGFLKDAKAKLAEIWSSSDDQNSADDISEENLFAEIVDADPEDEKSAAVKNDNADLNEKEKGPAEQNAEDKEKSEEKSEESSKENSEEKSEESSKENSEEKSEENAEEKSGDKTEDKSEEKSDSDTSDKQEDKTEDASDDNKNEQNGFTEKTEKSEKPKAPVISIIKNDNVTETSFDADKLREKLNVIESDEKDVLTDEQKRRLENDRRVQQKVNEFERKAAQASAKNDGEAAPAPITELEISNYRPESENQIRFTAGKFTESVKFEYECIVNYKKMISVSTKEALTEAPPEQPQENAARKVTLPDIRESDIPELKEARDFEKSHDKVDSIGRRLDLQDERAPEPIEYRSEEDAPEVRKYLTDKRKKASLTFNIMLGLTCAAFIFSCFSGRFTVGAGTLALASAQRIFALINFILYAGSVFCCRDIIIDGLKPLRNMKTNAYTGTAAAAAAAALQSLLSIIAPVSFMGQGLNVYTLIVMLTLLVTCAGRYFDADRISSNFRFVSDTAQKYAGKFFPDQRMVARLLSGTRNDKTELSFQKKTAFLKHFVRISNAEDPGDKLAASFALPTIVLSVIIALAAGIISKSFLDAVSVLCVMLCAGVPISAETLAAVPLHRLAKKSLVNKSMIVGYTAVDTFSESAAVMIDAKDLYPEGSIQLNDYRAFDSYRWNEGLNAAAAVTAAAGGAMSVMFDGMIDKQTRAALPTAEGVIYEDGKGLIGWVNNERVLIGNRHLLRSHGIYAPTADDEAQLKSNGDEILYIALSSTLVGVLLVGYTANHRVSDVLKRMEASDMSLLVRTIDVNITAEKIARDFGIGLKSIKVLEQKNSNVIRDEMVGRERTSPAFIATKGGVTSFGLAVSECIQTKRCISLSLAIEIVGALLKMLIVTAIVLFAGIHNISSIPIFIISLVWIGGVLVSPIIVQRFQKN